MRDFLFIACVFYTILCTAAGASDDCPEQCVESQCEESAIACESGVFVKDECSCCDVCLRSRNQICGGLHARFGQCEPGLKCVNDNSEAFMSDESSDVDNEEDDVIGVCQG